MVALHVGNMHVGAFCLKPMRCLFIVVGTAGVAVAGSMVFYPREEPLSESGEPNINYTPSHVVGDIRTALFYTVPELTASMGGDRRAEQTAARKSQPAAEHEDNQAICDSIVYCLYGGTWRADWRDPVPGKPIGEDFRMCGDGDRSSVAPASGWVS